MAVESLDERLLFDADRNWMLSIVSVPYSGPFAEVRAERLSSLEQLGLRLRKMEHPEPTAISRLLALVASASAEQPAVTDAEGFLKAANDPRRLRNLAKKVDASAESIAAAIEAKYAATRGGFLGFYPTYAAVGAQGTLLLVFATYYAIVLLSSAWGLRNEGIREKIYGLMSGRQWPDATTREASGSRRRLPGRAHTREPRRRSRNAS